MRDIHFGLPEQILRLHLQADSSPQHQLSHRRHPLIINAMMVMMTIAIAMTVTAMMVIMITIMTMTMSNEHSY